MLSKELEALVNLLDKRAVRMSILQGPGHCPNPYVRKVFYHGVEVASGEKYAEEISMEMRNVLVLYLNISRSKV